MDELENQEDALRDAASDISSTEDETMTNATSITQDTFANDASDVP